MARGFGPGPVFAYEWLTTSRRWQIYAGRSLFMGVLLAALVSVWALQVAGRQFATLADVAEVGRGCFGAIVYTELFVILMAAPAATAGGICQDRARGHLDLLLITDLSDAEIIVGKLAARLVPLLGLAGGTLPVLALGALLGGIDPLALAGSFLIMIDLAILGCTLALVLSIWGSKPYEVLLASYAVHVVWLLALPVWEFFVWYRGIAAPPPWEVATHPLMLAFAPYARPGTVGLVEYGGFTAASLIVAALLTALAVGRLRAVARRHADRPGTTGPVRRGHVGRRPARGAGRVLDAAPLAWYERHRHRPSPWIRALVVLYSGLAIGFTLLAIHDHVSRSTPWPALLPAMVNGFQTALGLSLLVLAAATAVVEERVRGNLDVLLATPLSTRQIVWAKWKRVFGLVPWLLALPALVAAVVAWEAKNWQRAVVLMMYAISAAAAWTSISLALSTWIARLGRAVFAAIGVYASGSLACAVLDLTGVANFPSAAGISLVSPYYGALFLTISIKHPGYLRDHLAWGLGWTAVNTAAAVALLVATLASFDRCLGRVRERNPDAPAGVNSS
jgi:ABC-type transport system involved in multi-copper enzyme maturation permease subunit